MAIDPNAATAQPSGWALGGLGAPSQSTIPLARPQSVLTPEQIAQLRQQAMTLQQPPEGGIHHWTQGLAELARAIQGNREADFARQQETAGRQQGAEATSSMLAPYLSPGPGGTPAPAAGGAPAGAGGGAGTGSAAQSTDTATQTADASAPRGIRNNNPLNIEDGQFARAQPGYAGSDGRFAKFETPEHGVGAADSLLTSYQNNHGLNTVAGIVGRWAPASDNNDTKAYASHVAAQMGIGPNDPIPPEMRPQLIAAMAQHENGRPLVLSAAPSPKAAPTGLLAPIQPPPAVVPPPAAPSAAPAPTAPTRIAYAGNPPPGMVPPTASPLSPMISAIAGQPIPPADFAKQAAAMEAVKAGGAAPLPTPGAAIPSADFASQAAAMEAAKGGPTVPPILASLPAQVSPAAVPPSPGAAPVPQAGPTAPLPPPFIPSGGSTPGAIGPTAVNGQPLDYTASLPRPPLGAPPANPAAVAAIAGRPVPPVAAPAVGGGSSIPPPPVQVAQNGPPTSAVPSPAGGPSGLPQPLTSPTGQINQGQLTQMLANPWVPDSAKAAMLTMIQQRGQPQMMDVEGGKLMYNAAGQKVFIPEPRFGTVEIGSAKIPTVSHFDPATGRWNTTTLAPGGGVQTGTNVGGTPAEHPAQAQGGVTQPDLSSIGGIQAAEAAQAGAKKGAETSAETGAKYYDSLHKGLAGSAMIASQQKQNIDALRQIANSPDFVSGTFADSALAMQRMASTLGINPTGAAPRELFNQLAARVLADQFSGLKSIASETGETGGRVFKPMLDIEEKANITPEDSAEGINAKLNLLDNAGNLMMKYGDMADDYVAKNGKLDPTFDKELRKEIAGSRIPNVVPQKEQSTAPIPSAPISKTINGKTYYQINGKVYDNPEGK